MFLTPTTLVHIQQGKLFGLLAKGLALFIGLLLFSSSTPLETSSSTLAWTVVHDQNGITISYDYSVCNGYSLICFKIDNANASDVAVAFEGEIKESNGSNMQELDFERIVLANSSIEGSCETELNPGGIYLILESNYSNPVVSVTVQ